MKRPSFPTLAAILAVFSLLPCAASANNTAAAWEFNTPGDREGWTVTSATGANAAVSIDGSTGVLTTSDITGNDPRVSYSTSLSLPPELPGWSTLIIRYRQLAGNPGASPSPIAFSSGGTYLNVSTGGGSIVSRDFPLIQSGSGSPEHWYTLELDISSLSGPITAIRFDPIGDDATRNFEIDSIRITGVDEILEPFNPVIGYSDSIAVWADASDVSSEIRLRFSEPGDYTIYRREYGTEAWGTPLVTGNGEAIKRWDDTTAQPGVAYEYAVREGSGYGYTLGTARADRAGPRGTIILAIAENLLEPQAARIRTVIEDLVGDGWRVRTLVVPYFTNNAFDNIRDQFGSNARAYGWYSYEAPARLRNQVRAIHHQEPEGVRMLYLLGHAPYAMSGIRIAHPDGHGSRGPFPTDHFYADIDGRWTDAGSSIPRTLRPEIMPVANLPGDGIYDQDDVPGRIELGVGRVDPFETATDAWDADDIQASEDRIAAYLDKAHLYKHNQPLPIGFGGTPELPGRRAVQRDNGGGQTGAGKEGYDLVAIFGSTWMDDVVQLRPDPVAPVTNGDIQQTINGGPYLYYGQSSSTPTPPEAGAKAVFRYAMQSWWGDWYGFSNSRFATMTDENMTLSWLYTGRFDSEWLQHPLGLGETMGEMMKLSVNQGQEEYLTGTPDYREPRFLRALVADPTLRLFVVPPPANLAAIPSGDDVNLTWDPPADTSAFVEYRVFRAPDLLGEFTEIARGLTSPTHTDANAPAGPKVYMVQAVHEVESGAGLWLNNSQGIFAELGLMIETAVVPSLPVGEDVTFNFVVSGASGAPSWSVVNGTLPPGLALAPDGTLTGNPITPGLYPVTLSVNDDAGVSVTREFPLFVDAAFTEIVNLDLRDIGGAGLSNKTSLSGREVTLLGSPQFEPGGGMRFDGDGDALRVHDMSNADWPDMSYYMRADARRGWALVAAFKADPTSEGGVILSRSTNLGLTWDVDQNQYTIRLDDSGRIQARSWTINYQSDPGYNDGQWHHVAAVVESGTTTLKLYVNGQLVASGSGGRNSIAEDLLIGARWDGPGEAAITDEFDGVISDVRIYNTGISAGEVRSLNERFQRSRPELSPQPPVLAGLPDAIAGSSLVLPFTATDPNGEPVRLSLLPGAEGLVTFHEFVRTASGYELVLETDPDAKGRQSVTVLADDGWPGQVVKHTIDLTRPGGSDDTFTAPSTSVLDLDVLGNDVAPNGSTLVLRRIVEQPSSGYVAIVDNVARYFPGALWDGPVTFTYELHFEPSGETHTATVTLTPESLPVAVEDVFEIASAGPVLLDVLSNDFETAGQGIELVSVNPQGGGTLRIVGQQVEYTPPSTGLLSQDSFDYQIRSTLGFYSGATVQLRRVVAGSEDPLVWLRFEEAATGDPLAVNSGSLGPAANATGSGTITRVDSADGKALALDGTSTRFDLGNPADLRFNPATDDFTVSMAVQIPIGTYPAAGSSYTLLSKENDSDIQFLLSIHNPGGGSNDAVSQRIELRIKDQFWYSDSPDVEPRVESTTTVSNWYKRPGYWYRIDGNYDDPDLTCVTLINNTEERTIRVYVDNWLVMLLDTASVDLDLADTGAPWVIGARPSSGGYADFHAEQLDNIRIFNRAILPSEIATFLAEIGQTRLDLHPVLIGGRMDPLPGSQLEMGVPVVFTPIVDDPDTPLDQIDFQYVVSGTGISTQVFDQEGPLTFTPPQEGSLFLRVTARQLVGNTPLTPSFSVFPNLNYTVGSTASQSHPAEIITDPVLPVVEAGRAMSATLQAQGGTPPRVWGESGGNLPPGLVLNPNTGEISGTPTTPGVYSFLVTLRDNSGGVAVRKQMQMQVLEADLDGDRMPDSWEDAHGGDLDPNEDDDGDGVSNALEYVLDGDPKRPDMRGIMELNPTMGPAVASDENYLIVRFARRLGLARAGLELFASPDLATWTRVDEAVTVLESDGEIEVVEVRVPFGGNTPLFHRLEFREE